LLVSIQKKNSSSLQLELEGSEGVTLCCGQGEGENTPTSVARESVLREIM